MSPRFEIELLEEAYQFLKELPPKHRNKIIQNMDRSRFHLDSKLFKKLNNEIWEFRTLFSGCQYRILAFWDKSGPTKTLVFATHGFLKKTSKVAEKEIDKADQIRKQYFQNK